MITRYRSGGATVTLYGDLEAFVRRAAGAATGASVEVIEPEMQDVARAARAKWYTLVERETGKSGDIDVITTVDADRNQVIVTVGSADTRTDRGKPVPAVVRSPGPTSLVEKEVDHATYWATPKPLRARYPFILVHNPKAGRRVALLESLVKGPARRRVKVIAPELARRFRRILEGRRG